MMMYQSKLVASLKANGKILREFKDTVYIPFGSEYSFLIKNLNTTRALVNIFIDGEDVIEGGLVLNAGQEVDLERYVKNGNLSAGNRFKFVERTAAIENGPRGVKLEDGLVRIEFQFEKPPMRVADLPEWQKRSIFGPMFGDHGGIVGSSNASEYPGTVDKYSKSTTAGWITASGATYSQVNVNGALRGVDYSKNGEVTAQAASAAVDKYCADNGIINQVELHDGMSTMDWMTMEQTVNDVGITVPGSKSEQKFQTTYMGAMEAEKHTIVLKLLGETADNKPVAKPVTVKHKPKCVTCGKQNKATAKFCTECGTALEIFA
jgi:zinc-ribbon domain